MDIRVFLRAGIRNEPWNEFHWYLFSILKRNQKQFKLGKKLIDFFIENNKLCLKSISFEIMKYSSRLSRDTLILVFLKRNPFHQKLWIQLFLDKVFLEEKLEILRSALFFFPRNRFFFDCTSLTLGFDVISRNEPYLNLKNFFFLATISEQNQKNLMEIRRLFRILNIVIRAFHISPMNIKKTVEIGKWKNISLGTFQDTLLIYDRLKMIQTDHYRQKLSLKLNNLMDFVKLKYLKFFKFQKKTDFDILLFLSKSYEPFFRNKITSILGYNQRCFILLEKTNMLSINKILWVSESFTLFFNFSIYKLESDLSEKDVCKQFFHKNLKSENLLFSEKRV